MIAGDLPAYDGDIVSAEAHRRWLAAVCRKASRALLPGPRPTAAGLEKHAQRFGPEQVAEVAAEYGVSVAITRAKAGPKRARGTSLKQRVAAYLAQGHGVDVIAELEDLTPGRARTLVNAALAAQAKESK
jgi:hypothetical protein